MLQTLPDTPLTPANPTVTSIATHMVPATRSNGDGPVNATQATWTRDNEQHCHPPLGGRTWAPRGWEQNPSPLTRPGEAEIPRGLITRNFPGSPPMEMFWATSSSEQSQSHLLSLQPPPHRGYTIAWVLGWVMEKPGSVLQAGSPVLKPNFHLMMEGKTHHSQAGCS